MALSKKNKGTIFLYIFMRFNYYVGLCPATTFLVFLFHSENLFLSSSIILRYWKQRINSNFFIL